MVSLKIDLISTDFFENKPDFTQLVKCYNILSVQHQPSDDNRTTASQTGVAGGELPAVRSCDIRAT